MLAVCSELRGVPVTIRIVTDDSAPSVFGSFMQKLGIIRL